MEINSTVVGRAYITVLTNRRYLPGVWALAQSLKKAKSQHELFVLIPEDKQSELQEVLTQWGLKTLTRPRLDPPEEVMDDGNKAHYWRETFFKLRAAGLIKFRKIILLDSDMIVMKNLDGLFQKPSFSAVAAGRSVIPSWIRLNSGLMVLEPSEALETQLLACIKPAIRERQATGLQVGYQDVFNAACPDWPQRTELHLPEEYNVLRGYAGRLCRKYIPGGYRGVFLFHFIGSVKPWDYTAVNYVKMFWHGVSQWNFAELRAFLAYRKYLKTCGIDKYT